MIRRTYPTQEKLRRAWLDESWAKAEQAPRVIVTNAHISIHIEGGAEPPSKRRSPDRRLT